MSELKPGDDVVINVHGHIRTGRVISAPNTRTRAVYIQLWSDRLNRYVKGVQMYNLEFVSKKQVFEPDEQRPNVVLNMEVADHHEYAGMDMSVNFKQRRIWTGFDLLTYDNAEEFLEGLLHMLSFAAKDAFIVEEEGSDWTDDDLQWGEQYDEGKEQ